LRKALIWQKRAEAGAGFAARQSGEAGKRECRMFRSVCHRDKHKIGPDIILVWNFLGLRASDLIRSDRALSTRILASHPSKALKRKETIKKEKRCPLRSLPS
jgi:hypothetical protein